jgi:hypothetical protein
MYCPFCNTTHRSLLDPDGGDGCEPYAEPDVLFLPIDMKVIKAALRKR